MSKRLNIKLFFLVIFMLSAAGCKESTEENDKNLAEAEKTKAELTRAMHALKKTQTESNDLNEGLSETLEEFEKIKLELALTTKTKDNLQNQVDKLTAQRDEALAKASDTESLADELASQLKEKTEEVKVLEELNEELLTTIGKLQEQLEEALGQATIEMYEEPNEQP